MNPQDGGGDEELNTTRPSKNRRMTYSEMVVPNRKRRTQKTSNELDHEDTEEDMSSEEDVELLDKSLNDTYPDAKTESRMEALQRKISEFTNKFDSQYGDCKPISLETAEEMMRSHSEKQAVESDQRLDAKLKAMSVGLHQEMSNSAKEIRQEITDSNEMLLREFTKLLEKHTHSMTIKNNQVQDNLLAMHENIVSISKGAGIIHSQQPLIVATTGAQVLWSGDASR